MTSAQPLLELLRGTAFDSIAIVDSSGKLLHSQGDPHTVAFLRSSVRLFQATVLDTAQRAERSATPVTCKI
jgi:L-asparaginase II